MSSTDMGTTGFTSLDADLLFGLSRLDTCTVANAIECTGVRLRNEGYMNATVGCLTPALAPLVGYAFTLRVRTSEPPIAGHEFVDRVDWWDRLLAVPSPRVLVVEDVNDHPASGSVLGDVHANIYRALGCAGVITNGAVRDLPGLEQLGFPAFAAHVSVSHAYTHVIDVGGPVTVGGLKVRAGDLMHGDRHGVLSIPLDIAFRLPLIAEQNHRRERSIIDFCNSPQFTIDGLKALLEQSSQ